MHTTHKLIQTAISCVYSVKHQGFVCPKHVFMPSYIDSSSICSEYVANSCAELCFYFAVLYVEKSSVGK